jgi:hypothetical protein
LECASLLALWQADACPANSGARIFKGTADDSPSLLVVPKSDEGGWEMAGLREDLQIKSASAVGAESL